MITLPVPRALITWPDLTLVHGAWRKNIAQGVVVHFTGFSLILLKIWAL